MKTLQELLQKEQKETNEETQTIKIVLTDTEEKEEYDFSKYYNREGRVATLINDCKVLDNLLEKLNYEHIRSNNELYWTRKEIIKSSGSIIYPKDFMENVSPDFTERFKVKTENDDIVIAQRFYYTYESIKKVIQEVKTYKLRRINTIKKDYTTKYNKIISELKYCKTMLAYIDYAKKEYNE